MMKNLNTILVLILLTWSPLQGQISEFNTDPDVSFKLARDLAFNGHKSESRDILNHILTKYPDYHDIRVFLGSTYSWDGLYEDAFESFNYVLKKDPMRKDAWIGAINNELWADHARKALNLAARGLQYFPDDETLLYKKASAQAESNIPEEAITTLESLIKAHPLHQKAVDYRNYLINELSYNTIGLRASTDLYSSTFDPMQYYAIKYGRQTKYGSIIGRVNFNRRFNSNGVQFELDAYPYIAKGLYAYLNLGFSNSFLFPKFRYGTELYKSLPHSLEASLGIRTLKYNSGSTYIFTGSIGHYFGNNYIFIRPYIIPNDLGSSKSGSINFRRYRKNAENYFSISMGLGYSPEVEKIRNMIDQNAIIKLNSQKFNIGYYFTMNANRNAWGANFGIAHQEISFNPGSYFWIYSLSFSCDIRIK